MIDFEKIQPKKIQLINLAYNFDLYSSPDDYEVENIKNKYPCDLLLLTACRLVGPKRPLLSLEIVKILSDRRLNVKLLVLGDGPDHQLLSEKIQQYNLQDVAFLLGFKTNIVDYISACDLFVHPSILDSSSVIIKEAGLQGKTVVACSGIGDVDEYLIHGKNAFLVSKEDTVNEMSMLIERIILDNKDLSAMGLALSESVISRFSIKTILPEYDRIHKDIKKYKE